MKHPTSKGYPYPTQPRKPVVEGDSRLSDARVPLIHAATHQNGGTDEINAAGLTGVFSLSDIQAAIAAGTITLYVKDGSANLWPIQVNTDGALDTGGTTVGPAIP